MTKWKPCRKALTVGVNVLSDPWAGAPVGGSKREAPRFRTSTPWRQSHLDRSASAPASRLCRRSTLAMQSSGWKISGKLEKKMSRFRISLERTLSKHSHLFKCSHFVCLTASCNDLYLYFMTDRKKKNAIFQSKKCGVPLYLEPLSHYFVDPYFSNHLRLKMFPYLPVKMPRALLQVLPLLLN